MTTWLLPLLIAALGVAGTLGGVFITQRSAERRDAATWERESERERERWAREDAARTYDERKGAYVAFYEANIEAMTRSFIQFSRVRRGEAEPSSMPSPWTSDAEQHLRTIEVYGSPATYDVAQRAQAAYRKYAHSLQTSVEKAAHKDDDTESMEEVQSRQDDWEIAVYNLLEVIRDDLGIPGAGPSALLFDGPTDAGN